MAVLHYFKLCQFFDKMCSAYDGGFWGKNVLRIKKCEKVFRTVVKKQDICTILNNFTKSKFFW